MHFTVTLEPQEFFRTEFDVLPVNPDRPREWPNPSVWLDPASRLGLRTWAESLPQLQTDWVQLYTIYNRSLTDLAALRFSMFDNAEQSLPAAGLPWFMTAFGRDSLITSYQALPYIPQLAEAALLTLAAFQAEKLDDFRDAEPGKILHEFRFGELTAFEEVPQSPYYGSADSTMWYLILLDEFERWTGRVDLVRQAEPIARAALEWIDKYGDRDGDGYVEYQRRNEKTGLENQCWKDSWNSIQWADGRLAELPRATCELQGYVYDAKMRCARLAREFWDDPEFANRLESEAADLKHRFNRDFWLEGKGYFALALDGKKQAVDALSSNIGHLLWSGIVDDDKAPSVVEHLMGERLFSGWGIRTFATGQIGYNPIGYHVGTVWPHDNAIIMLGLRRYGYNAAAAKIGMALLEAADVMGGRLPETFAGYSRFDTSFPAEYPTACSPQAWASGAPLMVVSGLLGLKPEQSKLESNPDMPEKIRYLQLLNIPGRWGTTDVGINLDDKIVIELNDRVGDEAKQVAQIFEGIARRINPRNAIGRRVTILMNLGDKGVWRIVADNGKVSVDQHDELSDVTFNMSLEMLKDILAGKQEINTAIMSGKVKVEGETSLMVRAIRVLARPNETMMPLIPGGKIYRRAA
jgi:glycogen debranching enzyme/putative sterol carrier protein